VRCGLEDPPDACWQAETTIDVWANLAVLLNELSDQARPGSNSALAKEVNNPDRDSLMPLLEMPSFAPPRPWDTPENLQANLRDLDKGLRWVRAWPWIVSTIPASVRENLYGPVYNIQNIANGQAPYVCSRPRDKIIGWLLRRRFYQTGEPVKTAVRRLQRMNGIDFGHYAFVPAHVWAGIFPAGADRFAEYRALDPWWQQQWQDEWRHPGKLWTQWDEDTRGDALRRLNSLLAVALVLALPYLTIHGALKAVQAWQNGEPSERIRAEIGQDVQGLASFLRVDSDIVLGDDQLYAGGVNGVGKWFKTLIQELS